jgi:hypothetical protein
MSIYEGVVSVGQEGSWTEASLLSFRLFLVVGKEIAYDRQDGYVKT